MSKKVRLSNNVFNIKHLAVSKAYGNTNIVCHHLKCGKTM